MRFLRLTLLHSYFSIINQNKKKALTLINIGIFLTIFAISSALISFLIETKISEKEEELIYLQIGALETGKELSDLEIWMVILEASFNDEETSKMFKQVFMNTKMGARTISQKDFYSPDIYYFGREVKEDFINPEFNIFDKDGPLYKNIIDSLAGVWDDEEVIKFKKSIINLDKSYKKIEKIDFNNFKYEKIPSLDEILKEVLDSSENDKIANYHSDMQSFTLSMINWGKQMIKYLKSSHAYDRDYINEINKEIISLSRNEKNIILVTFIFQLIIFIIIQFFEINSFESNFKKKTK